MAHFEHAAPPQSTSVSLPSFDPSQHWHVPPAAQTSAPAQPFFGSVPATTAAHVPSATPVSAFEHALQAPPQALSQHTPSTHAPVTHAAGAAQASPVTFLQAPAPSHAFEPEHAGLSSAPFSPMFVQLPTAPWRLHAVHGPSQRASQQLPSAQKPEAQSPAVAQCWPWPHREHAPPQSTSVSLPSLPPLLHVPALQIWPRHTALRQSAPFVHPRPSAHFCAHDPPQSTALSPPSCLPSQQVLHVPTGALQQPFDAQSPATVQASPSAQDPHAPPPQSTAVSLPFFTPSEQLGVQDDPSHAPPAQSDPCLQPFVGPHFAHAPPQSTSVSLPFFTPSPQAGTAHFFETPQSWLAQSLPLSHTLPSPHAAHASPPQSTSVSLPPFTPSPHDAATQRFATQTVGAAQSRGTTHATHAPVPLQNFPPFCQHGWPATLAACLGTPTLHESSVQSFASSESESSSDCVIPPLPSQTHALQSAGVWVASFVPPTANLVWQLPLTQEIDAQSGTLGAGHAGSQVPDPPDPPTPPLPPWPPWPPWPPLPPAPATPPVPRPPVPPWPPLAVDPPWPPVPVPPCPPGPAPPDPVADPPCPPELPASRAAPPAPGWSSGIGPGQPDVRSPRLARRAGDIRRSESIGPPRSDHSRSPADRRRQAHSPTTDLPSGTTPTSA